MKKICMLMGTLAIASSLLSATAMADTSTTTVKATEPKLIDKIIASYWGSYSGPSVTNPSRLTTDGDQNGSLAKDSFQNIDSTLTAGYRLADTWSLTGNYRFIYTPMSADGQDYTTKDPWLSVKNSKLIHVGGLNMSGDMRVYIPVQNAGKMNTALRFTQVTTYDIPRTRLTLGTYTIERANSIRQGVTMPNASVSLSGFGNYQLTPVLAATVWSDLIQIDYRFNQDISNKLIPVSMGVNWDITPNVSVNPNLNFYPSTATLETTTLGAILSAKFL